MFYPTFFMTIKTKKMAPQLSEINQRPKIFWHWAQKSHGPGCWTKHDDILGRQASTRAHEKATRNCLLAASPPVFIEISTCNLSLTNRRFQKQLCGSFVMGWLSFLSLSLSLPFPISVSLSLSLSLSLILSTLHPPVTHVCDRRNSSHLSDLRTRENFDNI